VYNYKITPCPFVEESRWDISAQRPLVLNKNITHSRRHVKVRRKKKIPVVPVPDRPYFFPLTLLFFQHDWLCDPIFSRWLLAAHTACQNGVCCHTNYWTKLPKFVHGKYASLVNIDVGTLLQIAQQKNRQNHEKNIQKKNLFPTYRP
jgi:hypothetical protein